MKILTRKIAADLLEVPNNALDQYPMGVDYWVDITKARNPQFHRKFFAMLNHAYESWEPYAEYKGTRIEKNFDRFRQELVILAGFYDIAPTISGDLRLVAKSISFGNMDEDEFAEVYSKVIDVVLAKILTNYTRDDLDEVVDKLIGFT